MKSVAINFLIYALAATVMPSKALTQEWHFNVLLDGSEIGTHTFSYDANRGNLTSNANFRVKFLFYTAYRYEHTSHEAWERNCMRKISSRTVENDQITEVDGEAEHETFVVRSPKAIPNLPSCVMSFAYWNPLMLEQRELLNPQTGEWVPVKIRNVGTELTTFRSKEVNAERFEILGPKLNINLWYLKEHAKLNWIALSAITTDQRVLRYEMR